MKLDIDCMRDVLGYLIDNLVIESDEFSYEKRFAYIDMKELYDSDGLAYNDNTIFYSVYNLRQCNYIDAKPIGVESRPSNMHIYNVTYAGHQFYETIRDKTVWEKTKSAAKTAGNQSLKMLGSIAEHFATAAASAVVAKMMHG